MIEIGVTIENSDFLPKLDVDESLAMEAKSAHLYLEEHDMGDGKLILTTRRIYWISIENPKVLNFSIDYKIVGLLAVCNDSAAWPVPCIYCQIDFEPDTRLYVSKKLNEILDKQVFHFERKELSNDESPMGPDEEFDDEDANGVSEWRFAPSDKSSLQELFSKMAEISALNYDATDDSDEEFFSDEDPFEICSSNN